MCQGGCDISACVCDLSNSFTHSLTHSLTLSLFHYSSLCHPIRHGTLVGHIRAKGMHTNLILTVKITEDSRFAFAGCLKGSMEMLAVDMGQIPMWRQHPSSATPSQKVTIPSSLLQ